MEELKLRKVTFLGPKTDKTQIHMKLTLRIPMPIISPWSTPAPPIHTPFLFSLSPSLYYVSGCLMLCCPPCPKISLHEVGGFISIVYWICSMIHLSTQNRYAANSYWIEMPVSARHALPTCDKQEKHPAHGSHVASGPKGRRCVPGCWDPEVHKNSRFLTVSIFS